MKITKKRIRNLEANIGHIKRGTKLMIGVRDIGKYQSTLKRIGFTEKLGIGESLLPPSSFGPVSRFNANGRYIKHRDLPMETAYTTVEWHWTEWHGPYREERSRFVDRPYKRYPRTFVPPPSIEMTILKTTKGESIIVSPSIEYVKDRASLLKHTINLFLEIFGECQFFTEDLDEIIKVTIKKLNWTILPRGRRPWPQLRKEIQPVIGNLSKDKRRVAEHRIETINKYSPDFAAVGEAGFRGYIVLGFSGKNTYILESPYYGNATYVFNERWEELSKKTKAEILDRDLQTDRIVHREGWENRVDDLFKGKKRV